MPKARVITWGNVQWRLSDLAREHRMLPQTLASRLNRGLTVERALATGLVTRSEAGIRSKLLQTATG
jgi:hypothetical protein